MMLQTKPPSYASLRGAHGACAVSRRFPTLLKRPASGAPATHVSPRNYGHAGWSSEPTRDSGQAKLPRWACRATVEPIPPELQIEVKEEDGTKNVDYDDEKKVVRIPLSALGDGSRRSKLVLFTCNKCGGRSARLVNPIAWEKGVVFGQCSKCGVWHVLQANNKKIFEEVRYKEDPQYADKDGLETDKAEELLKEVATAEEAEQK
ncbi:hypothetical protein HYH02_004558 [Chlamydomonas schloesseri]|uniref:DNL-type domain-containing protein n=1 Tax=Chlamydomonas schloesseri TaxID=2026947 RepID=A0A835WQA6_9CHLO|nr:hypothetical protein HYH02_004558 [Chlamydomonas schloesseri]|eukprot:KAG2450720.1 hypothetical protein HYH02_004558 [Chlamydomonas schloesseri]